MSAFPLTSSNDLEAAIPSIKALHTQIPERWRPSYVAFIRVGNNDYELATNHVLPIHTTGQHGCQRRALLPEAMFGLREEFIKTNCPFLMPAESTFQKFVITHGIDHILPDDIERRKLLFDYRFGATEIQNSRWLMTGRAFHLDLGEFRSPCVKGSNVASSSGVCGTRKGLRRL
jgi:hypothetical protein